MVTQEFTKKDKCPSCESTKLRDGTTTEEGEEFKIQICKSCGWWG